MSLVPRKLNVLFKWRRVEERENYSQVSLVAVGPKGSTGLAPDGFLD